MANSMHPIAAPPIAHTWLPGDHSTAMLIARHYFDRLHQWRPILSRDHFLTKLDQIYRESTHVQVDPGLATSVYVVLALGTLLHQTDTDIKGLPHYSEWPSTECLFEQALSLRTNLAFGISTLEALLLFHHYWSIVVRGSPCSLF